MYSKPTVIDSQSAEFTLKLGVSGDTPHVYILLCRHVIVARDDTNTGHLMSRVRKTGCMLRRWMLLRLTAQRIVPRGHDELRSCIFWRAAPCIKYSTPIVLCRIAWHSCLKFRIVASIAIVTSSCGQWNVPSIVSDELTTPSFVFCNRIWSHKFVRSTWRVAYLYIHSEKTASDTDVYSSVSASPRRNGHSKSRRREWHA